MVNHVDFKIISMNSHVSRQARCQSQPPASAASAVTLCPESQHADARIAIRHRACRSHSSRSSSPSICACRWASPVPCRIRLGLACTQSPAGLIRPVRRWVVHGVYLSQNGDCARPRYDRTMKGRTNRCLAIFAISNDDVSRDAPPTGRAGTRTSRPHGIRAVSTASPPWPH